MAEKIYGQAALTAAKRGGYTIFLAGDASTKNRPTILSIEKAEMWVKKAPNRVFATARGPRAGSTSTEIVRSKSAGLSFPVGAKRSSPKPPSRPSYALPPARGDEDFEEQFSFSERSSHRLPPPPLPPFGRESYSHSPMDLPSRSPRSARPPAFPPSRSSAPKPSRSPRVGGLIAYEAMLSALAHSADRVSLAKALASVEQAHKGGQLNATEYGKLRDIALYMAETFSAGHRPKRAIPQDLKPFLKSHGMVAGSKPKKAKKAKKPAKAKAAKKGKKSKVGATEEGIKKALDLLLHMRGVRDASIQGYDTIFVTLDHDTAEMRRRCKAAVAGVYHGSLEFGESGASLVGKKGPKKMPAKKKKTTRAKKASKKKVTKSTSPKKATKKKAAKKRTGAKKKTTKKKKVAGLAIAGKKKATKKKKTAKRKTSSRKRKTTKRKKVGGLAIAGKKKATKKRKSSKKKTAKRRVAGLVVAAKKKAPKKKAKKRTGAKKRKTTKRKKVGGLVVAAKKKSPKKKKAKKGSSAPKIAALTKSGKYFVAIVKHGSKYCGCRYAHIVTHSRILADYKANPSQFSACTSAGNPA